MTDFQRCQSVATGSACPEKAAGLFAPRHLELIREAQQALHRATAEGCSPEDMTAWQVAAERLAVALVARLEGIEGDNHE
ncbi:hypothetical protein [Azotobacter salinestris]|uniref:hypothetical protein n=1 Tax=Azotobacter salinestris TaxID=69964 RepID=UPI001266A9D9|nr:hypothetical protein [Azotobacter salinestris]